MQGASAVHLYRPPLCHGHDIALRTPPSISTARRPLLRREPWQLCERNRIVPPAPERAACHFQFPKPTCSKGGDSSLSGQAQADPNDRPLFRSVLSTPEEHVTRAVVRSSGCSQIHCPVCGSLGQASLPAFPHTACCAPGSPPSRTEASRAAGPALSSIALGCRARHWAQGRCRRLGLLGGTLGKHRPPLAEGCDASGSRLYVRLFNCDLLCFPVLVFSH